MAWSGLVRAAIVWAGQPDPWATNVSARSEIDTEAGELEALVAAWNELSPDGEAITVADAKRKYDERGEFGLPETADFLASIGLTDFNTKRVGNLLRKHAGRPLSDGYCIVGKKARSGVKAWQVDLAGRCGGSGGPGGSVLANNLFTRAHEESLPGEKQTHQTHQSWQHSSKGVDL